MEYDLVFLSGGKGSRMKKPIPKQYMLLAGKPIIIHTLERVDAIEKINKVIIVCADEYIDSISLMLRQYNITKKVEFASAGDTRKASVYSGLQKVESPNTIIHEAARPFVTVEDYMNLIDDENENVVFGCDIPFTVLKGREIIDEVLVRDELINIQLPQKFNSEMLLVAHKEALKENKFFTDDSSLVFNYNPTLNINVIKGNDFNIKLTNNIDMVLGEVIYDEHFRRRK